MIEGLQAIDPEYEERMLAFEMDCDKGKGDAWACHSVGEFLAVVKGDYNKAAKVYTDNCAKYSHPPSCFNLGRLYLGGRGVPQSDTRSLKCFDTSCKAGHGMACHHMGLLLLYGKDGGYDVSKDVKKATGILNKACGEGIPDSCYALASHLLRHLPEDKSHERDALKAKGLLEQGCARGHGPSCFNLAVMHKKGDTGIPRNEQEFEKYKKVTEDLVEQTGALTWKKGH
ncbi:hcp beta-lactamase-like protein [Nannochloropsis gaditana]|uniref:Hcp beta-lactamase-like protein n=1 Tax=Nannochloropsis gaditana TaxID=72520 RepID=W7TNA5_9STRA|nr:hcp beta-lactamase-like protein [Nannochloropsis gaditana]